MSNLKTQLQKIRIATVVPSVIIITLFYAKGIALYKENLAVECNLYVYFLRCRKFI